MALQPDLGWVISALVRRSWSPVMLLLIAGAAIATSCSSDATPADALEQADVRAVSPIAVAIGVEVEGDFAEAANIEAQQEAEYYIANCMASRGFEYEPSVIQSVYGTAKQVGEDLPPAEFAETYGLGFAPVFLESYGKGPEGQLPAPDPNRSIYTQLGEAERLEWYLALWGYDSGPATYDPIPGRNLQEPCFDLSTARLTEISALLTPLQFDRDSIEELVRSDPRIVDAEAEWSQCMNAQGFSYSTEIGMRQSFLDELQLAYGPGSTDDTPQPVGTINSSVQEQMEEISVRERAAALANLECARTKADIYAVVRYEIEGRFVNDNQDKLRILGQQLAEVRDGS